MKKNEFEIELLNELNKRTGDLCTVNAISVLKNNDTLLKGFRFERKDSAIHPTIYLDRYYDMYCDGKSITDIADIMYGDYTESLSENEPDLSFFTDYEKMRERIVCKLISVSRNEGILRDVPHVPFLDLAVVFYCSVKLSSDHVGTVLIRNQHFKNWNVSADRVYRDALANNRRILGITARPITDVLKEMIACFKRNDEDWRAPEGIGEGLPMYVLTNEKGMNGAACMLDISFLSYLGQKFGGGFFILPSSVHELIALPGDREMSVEKLKEMVRTINESEVPREEVLSDEVYFFDIEKNAVMLA